MFCWWGSLAEPSGALRWEEKIGRPKTLGASAKSRVSKPWGAKLELLGWISSGGKKVTGLYAEAAQFPMAASALQPGSGNLYHLLRCYQILWN